MKNFNNACLKNVNNLNPNTDINTDDSNNTSKNESLNIP